jgi:hypothetical protein
MARCGICFDEEVQDPIFTPCIHGFCSECIAKWIVEKKRRRVIPCPVCKFDISEIAGYRNEDELYEDDDLIPEELAANDPDLLLFAPPILRRSANDNAMPAHLLPNIMFNGQSLPILDYLNGFNNIIDIGRGIRDAAEIDRTNLQNTVHSFDELERIWHSRQLELPQSQNFMNLRLPRRPPRPSFEDLERIRVEVGMSPPTNEAIAQYTRAEIERLQDSHPSATDAAIIEQQIASGTARRIQYVAQANHNVRNETNMPASLSRPRLQFIPPVDPVSSMIPNVLTMPRFSSMPRSDQRPLAIVDDSSVRNIPSWDNTFSRNDLNRFQNLSMSLMAAPYRNQARRATAPITTVSVSNSQAADSGSNTSRNQNQQQNTTGNQNTTSNQNTSQPSKSGLDTLVDLINKRKS